MSSRQSWGEEVEGWVEEWSRRFFGGDGG